MSFKAEDEGIKESLLAGAEDDSSSRYAEPEAEGTRPVLRSARPSV